jgi:Regulator of chromosome condensation (RCC1) repeat
VGGEGSASGEGPVPEAGAPPFDACGPSRSGAPCDDLNPCTQDDACHDGRCAGTPFLSKAALLGSTTAYGRGPILPTSVSVTAQALSGAAQFVGAHLVFADASSYGTQLSLVAPRSGKLELKSHIASPLTWATYSPSGWLFSRIPTLTLTALGTEHLVVTSGGKAELYRIAGSRLERLGASDAPDTLGVVPRGEELFTCGRGLTRNHFDAAHQLVTDATTSGIGTCLSLALSNDEQSLYVAGFEGLWRVELTADGFGAATQLSANPAFSIDAAGGVLAVQRIQGSTTLGDVQLYREEAPGSPWFTFPTDAPEGIPLGSALLDHGILLLRQTGTTVTRNVAEYYGFEGESVVRRGSFVISESARNRSVFMEGVRLARQGTRVLMQPLRRVLEVDEATGAITELRGAEQGYFAAPKRISADTIVSVGPASTHLVDTTDPAAPRVVRGGLLAPTVEPLQLTLADDTHPVAELGAQRWLPAPGSSLSLIRMEQGEPVLVGSVTLQGGSGRLYPFEDKLLLVESVSSAKLRVLQYGLGDLADGRALESEAQQTLSGALTDLQAVDPVTGELFVALSPSEDTPVQVLRYRRGADQLFRDPVGLSLDGMYPARVLSAAAGRVVLGSSARLVVIDASGQGLNLAAEAALTSPSELVSIIQHDGAQVAVGIRDPRSADEGLSVRRLSDLREVARYALSEAPVALTSGAAVNALTTGNQLVTLSPQCPLEEVSNPCAEPGARRCRDSHATEACSTETNEWEPSESCVNECNDGRCVTGEAVSVGHRHACVLLSDSTVRCFGRPDLLGANLPAGSTPAVPQTVLIGDGAAALSASAVASGSQHSCAITTDGALTCWGQSLYGELGGGLAGAAAGANTAQPALDEDGLPLLGVLQVSVGGHTSCALIGGTVRCAGWGWQGQLGNGETGVTANRDSFEPVVTNASAGTPLGGVTSISTGYLHVCARLDSGEARCWGNNELGQLGDGAGGAGKRSALPVVVRSAAQGPPLDGVVQLASGYAHACAVLAEGTARCWGEGRDGELGRVLTNGATFSDVPLPVLSAEGEILQGVKQVALGWQFSCVLLEDSTVHCFGSGRRGELADGSAGDTHAGLLERVLLGAEQKPRTGITALSAGFHAVCIRTALSGVECGGANLSEFRYGADDHVARGLRF